MSETPGYRQDSEPIVPEYSARQSRMARLSSHIAKHSRAYLVAGAFLLGATITGIYTSNATMPRPGKGHEGIIGEEPLTSLAVKLETPHNSYLHRASHALDSFFMNSNFEGISENILLPSGGVGGALALATLFLTRTKN